jgi:ribonucleotide reductase class II
LLKNNKMLVIKRDGTKVPLDDTKIKTAVYKAFIAQEYEGVDASRHSITVTQVVMSNLHTDEETEIPIERIQDRVESVLMDLRFFKVGKAYILYREKRAEARKTLKFSQSEIGKVPDYFNGDVLGQFVYTRTYSRWREEDGRREVWPETVERFVDFMKSEMGSKITDSEYDIIRQSILKMEVMPSMRLLQFAGPAAKRCHACAYNCAFIAPESPQDLAEIMYLSMSGTGVGFSVEAIHVNKFPQISLVDTSLEDQGDAHFVIDDSKEGWADAFAYGMNRWFTGRDVFFDYSHLRPTGARLKTTGGRSSGPQPLKDLMNFTRDLMKSKIGMKLSPLNIHDIICKIGQIVIAGGVRRSALISLSDLNDSEIRDCKTGQFWNTNSQRTMSNNSAVYNSKPTDLQFMNEWLRLAESGSGERGIFNRSGLSKVLPTRRVEFLGDAIHQLGGNPCVTGDTWVQTIIGPAQVRELIGVEMPLIVNGKICTMESQGFFKTGTKEVFEVTTYKGYKLKLTANHKLLKLIYKSEKITRDTWVETRDLEIGDQIALSNHRSYPEWDGEGSFEEGWLLGQIVGDGGIIIETSATRNNSAYLRFWLESAEEMKNIAVDYVKKFTNHRSDFAGSFNTNGDTWNVRTVGLYKLCQKYGIRDDKSISEVTERTSSAFHRGFIRGFFDADGSVQGNLTKGISVRLAQADIPRLQVVQRMLARLGIISTLRENRSDAQMRMMPDGSGGQKEYFCQAMHELCVSIDNIIHYADLVGFHEPKKTKLLAKLISEYKRKPNRESFYDKVISIQSLGEEHVYDVTVSDAHEFCANGIRAHNCLEILVQSKEFCNLTEVICRPGDKPETLARKIAIATLIGTFQSSLTNFKYLSPKWRENQENERLLGVSLTGIMDSELLSTKADSQNKHVLLYFLKNTVIETNVAYAKRFGIKPSMATTCVKPSGTVSQMTNSSSGIHARYAPFYIRRVRIAAHDPLFNLMKNHAYPHYPETGQDPKNPNTWVLEFPVAAPQNAVCTEDMSALKQLELWKQFKIHYTEHNPSVTISVKPNEWIDVQKWVMDNWDYITGLSFLPHSDHSYPLAPYEEISEEEYNDHICRGISVNFSKLAYYEKSDTTDVKREIACSGISCEL